jgi:protein-disulfide isomerase
MQLIFWPVINHGNPSIAATVTFECVGQQSIEMAWQLHPLLFQNVNQLYYATRDDFVNYALQVGADQAAFETCYDGPDALNLVLQLDQIRRERGIRGQPYFDVNGIVLAGTGQLLDTIAAQSK